MWLALGAMIAILVVMWLLYRRLWSSHARELQALKQEHKQILDDGYRQVHSMLERNSSGPPDRDEGSDNEGPRERALPTSKEPDQEA